MSPGRQHTLKRACALDPGIGLHTGASVKAVCKPAAEGHGIRFARVDLSGSPEISADIDNARFDRLANRTALAGADGVEVATVEHLLAACLGLGIDNLRVELDGAELPIYDGSAAPFSEKLLAAGLAEQAAERAIFGLTEPAVFRDQMIEITALPSRGLRLTYFADFPEPIGSHTATFEITPEIFASQIAPARTFVLEGEIQALRDKGLIRGASAGCAVVFGEKGPLNAKLLFPNEIARHKLLDLLGDLSLLGAAPRGHFMASRSGHRTHAEFVRRLRKEYRP